MLFDTKPPEHAIDYIAIGSIHFLGLFIILDALSGFLSFFEVLAGFSAWAIVAAVPVLVFAYILGLFSTVITEALFSAVIHTMEDTDLLIKVAAMENSLLVQKYLELLRLKRILLGSSPAFVILAIGVVLQIPRQAENLGIAFHMMIIGFIAIAAISPVLAFRLTKQAIAISKKSESIQRRVQTVTTEAKDQK